MVGFGEYYKCPDNLKGACSMETQAPAPLAEKEVLSHLTRRILEDSAFIDQCVAMVESRMRAAHLETPSRLARLERELE